MSMQYLWLTIIGVLKLEPSTFKKLDDDIMKVLMDYKVHLQPANKERLYLPRDQLGRWFSNIEHRSELMLLELNKSLERDNSTHLALINWYLISKYKCKHIMWSTDKIFISQY